LRRAIIVAESQRRNTKPTSPYPAIDRFSGVYFRTIKKYLREGKLPKIDIIIVSRDFGILRSKDKIPYSLPVKKLSFDTESIGLMRETNLRKLRQIFQKGKYDEIYVNVGREFYKLIEGFEKLTSAKIIYASGLGLGPKAQHMRDWILTVSEGQEK